MTLFDDPDPKVIAAGAVSGLFLLMVGIILGHEGGFVDDPADLGGATKMGITEEVARSAGYTDNMESLSHGLATDIYYRQYWKPLGLDYIGRRDTLLSYLLFDMAVNMGPGTAGRYFQRCLNLLNDGGGRYKDVSVDGAVGPQTIGSFDSYRDRYSSIALTTCVNGLRVSHYIRISERRETNERFFRGWMNRASKVPLPEDLAIDYAEGNGGYYHEEDSNQDEVP